MAATIKDIREKTGLSLATISKYLNGGNVLPENSEKIEAAIEELHYEVNEIARGLVTNKTRTIGMVVYCVESVFNGTLIRHVGELLRREGYGLLICDSNYSEEREADNICFLTGKKVDGILVVPVANDAAFLGPARQRGIPVVLLDRPIAGSGCSCVRIDNRKAAAQAVSSLISKNHKDIAVICSAKEYTGIELYMGYTDAMQAAGLERREEYQKHGAHLFDHGYHSMKELLGLERKPTAIFMTNYDICLGAVAALQESAYRCPEDISLMGFDSLQPAFLVEPQMCVIVQPMEKLAEIAVVTLLKQIRGRHRETEALEAAGEEILLDAAMVEGNSVRVL